MEKGLGEAQGWTRLRGGPLWKERTFGSWHSPQCTWRKTQTLILASGPSGLASARPFDLMSYLSLRPLQPPWVRFSSYSQGPEHSFLQLCMTDSFTVLRLVPGYFLTRPCLTPTPTPAVPGRSSVFFFMALSTHSQKLPVDLLTSLAAPPGSLSLEDLSLVPC